MEAILAQNVLQYSLTSLKDDESLKEQSWAVYLDEQFDIFDIEDADDILEKCDEILNSPIISFFDHFKTKYQQQYMYA